MNYSDQGFELRELEREDYAAEAAADKRRQKFGRCTCNSASEEPCRYCDWLSGQPDDEEDSK